MTLIQNTKFFAAKKQPHKPVILLCGFGGAIWQTKRLITTLNRAGYDVTALDFSKKVLNSGDPKLLLELVDEVVAFVEDEAQKTEEKILLIGISLGSLLTLNVLRRSKLYATGIGITGGNIVDVAQNIYGSKVWPQTHAELSELWKGVNIHTDPKRLAGKRMLFVLPTKDKLIDTREVLAEIKLQAKNGNIIELVERGSFGHVGTIIEETILFPGRVKGYIDRLGLS
ncbi:MAG TPA: alpha/beta hydrolase [Candidatus Saccharimonadales bacterium]|jgi:pimeloyl-ACP methyl ester carboxylesterase